MRLLLLSLCFCLLASPSLPGIRPASGKIVGKEAEGFSLRNVDGRLVSLTDYADNKGLMVVFTCNHCPFAKLYTDRLNELNEKYLPMGVPLIAVNPMDSMIYMEESFKEMQVKAQREGFTFPYLQDAAQDLGRAFKVEHTPHAFLIWRKGDRWFIRYSGAIDDNGEHPDLANSWLSHAVEQSLKGEKVEPQETSSFGCRVFYRR